MKKSSIAKVLIVMLAVSVIGAALFIGGCGSDDSSPAPFRKGNVFISSILSQASLTTGNGANDASLNYKFMHGCSSHDNTQMFIVVNEATYAMGASTNKAFTFMLDAAELEKGKVVKLAEGTLTGKTGMDNTTFRCNWTIDDTRVLLSGGEHFWVIDATSATLDPLNTANGDTTLGNGLRAGTFWHNHDALATSDDKYAVLTIRSKPYSSPTDSNKLDGDLMLYNIQDGSYGVVGTSVSVCDSCHQTPPAPGATLCGIDGNLDLQPDNTYTGTVYVAGHGGHFAKLALTINPTDPLNTITVDAQAKLTVSTLKFPANSFRTNGSDAKDTSQYKLHDGRLDGNTLYWSTYTTDAKEKVHYGKIDLTTEAVIGDTAIGIPGRATKPSIGKDTGPIYCASGQTETAFMPITMTNEAYITVIPKADIK